MINKIGLKISKNKLFFLKYKKKKHIKFNFFKLKLIKDFRNESIYNDTLLFNNNKLIKIINNNGEN